MEHPHTDKSCQNKHSESNHCAPLVIYRQEREISYYTASKWLFPLQAKENINEHDQNLQNFKKKILVNFA